GGSRQTRGEGVCQLPVEGAAVRHQAVEGAAEDEVLDDIAGDGGAGAEVGQRGERRLGPGGYDRVEVRLGDALHLLQADPDRHILDFGFWILDYRPGQDFQSKIQNPK